MGERAEGTQVAGTCGWAYPGWNLRASTAGVLAADFFQWWKLLGSSAEQATSTPVAPTVCVAHAPAFSLLCSWPSAWSLAGVTGEQVRACPGRLGSRSLSPLAFPGSRRLSSWGGSSLLCRAAGPGGLRGGVMRLVFLPFLGD